MFQGGDAVTFDPYSILLATVTGGVGFVLFTYGRKQQRLPQLVGGLALMVYPFFVTSTGGLLLGAVLVAAATWGAVRLGW
jgi:hypothetical protein